MEITYIYGNVIVGLPAVNSRSLRLRLPTAIAPLHSQSTDMVGSFQKWKYSHKRRSYLIRFTMNTSLHFIKKIISLFSPE